jgi:hypothetical protein
LFAGPKSLLVLLLLAVPGGYRSASAQPLPMPERAYLVVDSAGRGAAGDTLVDSRKSTGTAMLLSAILPGAGQFYNGSYWKVPVVLGLGLYFASSWLDNNRRAIDARDKYSATADPKWLTQRDFYKSQRDSFTWYYFILYAVNIADAYVDAALSDFNVSPELSFRTIPEPGGMLTLRVRF